MGGDVGSAGNIQYRKECILYADCPLEESIAAVYDYVGSVYGELETAEYDDVLTLKEREAVEKKFGVLTRGDQIVGYVSRARTDFLERYSLGISHPGCKDPSLFRYYATSAVGDSNGVVALGGHHLCGKEYGDMYFSRGVELAVASDPSYFVFFIENYEEIALMSGAFINSPVQEYALFNQIAESLGIPILDAVPLNAYSDEVLTELEERHQVSREEVAVLFTHYIIDSSSKQLGELEGWQYYLLLYGTALLIAPELEMDPEDLMDYTLAYWSEANDLEGYDLYDYLNYQKIAQEHVVSLVTGLANELSLPVVKESLKQYPNRTPIFIIGSGHMNIPYLVDDQ